MIAALLVCAFAEPPAKGPPVAPARVGRARLIEPIAELMSDRTKAAVGTPGTALLEWSAMGDVKLGDYVDLWTRSPKGVCLVAPRAQVVLLPSAEGDLKHATPVIRVKAAAMEKLRDLEYVAWTPRREDDPRDYPDLACAFP